MKNLIALLPVIFLFLLASCSQFKAERQDAKTSDEKALSITDNWVDTDTTQVVNDVKTQLSQHAGLRRYLAKHKGQAALFVAQIQNRTSEAYFPIDDLNNELLHMLSSEGDYTLVDEQARAKILSEVTYQNDGMVDTASAKSIGKQTGADLLIFGSVQMKPEMRDGKTVKQYSVDFRLTDLELGTEIARTRSKVFKYSAKTMFGL